MSENLQTVPTLLQARRLYESKKKKKKKKKNILTRFMDLTTSPFILDIRNDMAEQIVFTQKELLL